MQLGVMAEEPVLLSQISIQDEFGLVSGVGAVPGGFASALADSLTVRGIPAEALSLEALESGWPSDYIDALEMASGSALGDAAQSPAAFAVVVLGQRSDTVSAGRLAHPLWVANPIVSALAHRQNENLLVCGGGESIWVTTVLSDPAATAEQVVEARNKLLTTMIDLSTMPKTGIVEYEVDY